MSDKTQTSSAGDEHSPPRFPPSSSSSSSSSSSAAARSLGTDTLSAPPPPSSLPLNGHPADSSTPPPPPPPRASPSPRPGTRLLKHLLTPVPTTSPSSSSPTTTRNPRDRLAWPLLLCYFVSGLCDSSAYNAYACFVSMQTGNTIFLALGAADLPQGHPFGWLKSLVSIAAFAVGCVVFAQTRRLRFRVRGVMTTTTTTTTTMRETETKTKISPVSRGVLAAGFFVQTVCLVVAAALVQSGVVPPRSRTALVGGGSDDGSADNADGTPPNSPYVTIVVSAALFRELGPLILLAFQSGGQMMTSRLLGMNEIPTTVLTSVYCDLVSDTRLLAARNPKRDHRVGAVVAILVGGLVGGWLTRASGSLAGAVWLAAGIKGGIVVAWLCWWGEEEKGEEELQGAC